MRSWEGPIVITWTLSMTFRKPIWHYLPVETYDRQSRRYPQEWKYIMTHMLHVWNSYSTYIWLTCRRFSLANFCQLHHWDPPSQKGEKHTKVLVKHRVDIPSLKQTARTWKCMVGLLVSFWDGLFWGAMLVLGSVIHLNHVSLVSLIWRSLNNLKGSLNHPKKGTKNCQEGVFKQR